MLYETWNMGHCEGPDAASGAAAGQVPGAGTADEAKAEAERRMEEGRLLLRELREIPGTVAERTLSHHRRANDAFLLRHAADLDADLLERFCDHQRSTEIAADETPVPTRMMRLRARLGLARTA